MKSVTLFPGTYIILGQTQTNTALKNHYYEEDILYTVFGAYDGFKPKR